MASMNEEVNLKLYLMRLVAAILDVTDTEHF